MVHLQHPTVVIDGDIQSAEAFAPILLGQQKRIGVNK